MSLSVSYLPVPDTVTSCPVKDSRSEYCTVGRPAGHEAVPQLPTERSSEDRNPELGYCRILGSTGSEAAHCHPQKGNSKLRNPGGRPWDMLVNNGNAAADCLGSNPASATSGLWDRGLITYHSVPHFSDLENGGTNRS